ncbi:hypothetical protein Btru_005116 [Bulinus truncatus]|nr:hypothetical protein Btru_005116 [Bulinus truncatus]
MGPVGPESSWSRVRHVCVSGGPIAVGQEYSGSRVQQIYGSGGSRVRQVCGSGGPIVHLIKRPACLWVMWVKSPASEEFSVSRINQFFHPADFYRKRAVLNINDESGSNATGQTKLWTPLGAIIYSYSVITTIGWGNIVPGTDNGKMVTIVYGIFGIPLLFALSTDTGNMVAAFNLKLWKLIHGIYKVASRLLGLKKKEEEEEEDTDSDDNENRKRNLSGSNASGAVLNWNRPLDKTSLTELKREDCLRISRRLARKVQQVTGDVRRTTSYLRSTESTVDFLLDLALKTDESDFERTLQSMTPHRRILSYDDALQLVSEFNSMTLSEFKLCAELVGVSWKTFSRFFVDENAAANSVKTSGENVPEKDSEIQPCSGCDNLEIAASVSEDKRKSSPLIKSPMHTSPMIEIEAKQTLAETRHDSAKIQNTERSLARAIVHSLNKISEDATELRSDSRTIREIVSRENIFGLQQTDVKTRLTNATSREIITENNDVAREGAHVLTPLNVIGFTPGRDGFEWLDTSSPVDHMNALNVSEGPKVRSAADKEFDSNLDQRTKKLAIIFRKVFEVEQQGLVPGGGGDGKAVVDKGRLKRADNRGRSSDVRCFGDGRVSTIKHGGAPSDRESRSVGPRSMSGAAGKSERGSVSGENCKDSRTTSSSRSVAGSLVVETGSCCGDGDNRKSDSSDVIRHRLLIHRPGQPRHRGKIKHRNSANFDSQEEERKFYGDSCIRREKPGTEHGDSAIVAGRKIDKFKTIDVLRFNGQKLDDVVRSHDSINGGKGDAKRKGYGSPASGCGPESGEALSDRRFRDQDDLTRCVGDGDWPSVDVCTNSMNGNNHQQGATNEKRATGGMRRTGLLSGSFRLMNGKIGERADESGSVTGVNGMGCSGFVSLHAKMSPYARNVETDTTKEAGGNNHSRETLSGLGRVHSCGTVQSAVGKRNVSHVSKPCGSQMPDSNVGHRNDHNDNHRYHHNVNHICDHNMRQAADCGVFMKTDRRDNQLTGHRDNQMADYRGKQMIDRRDNQMADHRDKQMTDRRDNQMADRRDNQMTGHRDKQMTDRRDNQMADRRDNQMTGHRDKQMTGRRDNQMTDHRDDQMADRRDNKMADRRDNQMTDRRDDQMADRRDNQMTDHRDNQMTEHRDKQMTDRRDNQITDHRDNQITDYGVILKTGHGSDNNMCLIIEHMGKQRSDHKGKRKTDHIINQSTYYNMKPKTDHNVNLNPTSYLSRVLNERADQNENKRTDHSKNRRNDHNENRKTNHCENRTTDHNENRRADHNDNLMSDHNENRRTSPNENRRADHNENRRADHNENRRADPNENRTADHNENRTVDHNENRTADHNVNFKDFFDDIDDDDAASVASMSEVSDDFSMYSEDDADSGGKDKSTGGGGGKGGGENNLPLSVLYLFVIMYILAGSFVYHHFSLDKESQIQNWVYFIYVTLSTTGFGDILPEEHMLLFTAIYGLLGMAIFNILLNATLETFLYAIDYINAFNVGADDDDGSDES